METPVAGGASLGAQSAQATGNSPAPAAAPRIPASTTVGAVHLTVSDLQRSLDFYQRAIGLESLRGESTAASLGVRGRELVVLVQQRGARPDHSHTGLYHFALLLPRRTDLAKWLAHAVRDEVSLVGAADHFVSEALYLSDPDGHGIEICVDRPREVWEGQVARRMTTAPLDVDGLLGGLRDGESSLHRLPDSTVIGHVHLRVARIPETIAFYRDLLGFSLMAQLGAQAAFFGAGGYHHHIGANTWESAGASPPPPHSAALRCATIVLPTIADREQILDRLKAAGKPAESTPLGPVVRDPSENALLLAVP
jgi:catechol 2,3-dioxygenase